MRITATESETLHACLDFLNALPGVKVWRQNTGASVLTDTHGKKRFVRYGQKGQADLTGIQTPSGRRIEVEIKRTGQKPSADQHEWLAVMHASGAVCFWTDSIDDCMKKAREYGLCR